MHGENNIKFRLGLVIIYLFAESNVLQPNIASRMSSFITVIEKGAKKKGNACG
jgi:hypothetical protein